MSRKKKKSEEGKGLRRGRFKEEKQKERGGVVWRKSNKKEKE